MKYGASIRLGIQGDVFKSIMFQQLDFQGSEISKKTQTEFMYLNHGKGNTKTSQSADMSDNQ